jgi:hypothetical protein
MPIMGTVALNQESQIEVGSFGERRNKIFVLERARWMLLPTPCCGPHSEQGRTFVGFLGGVPDAIAGLIANDRKIRGVG